MRSLLALCGGLFAAAALGACTGDSISFPPIDAGLNILDAGSPPVDAGTPVVDAGSPDAGPPDAGAATDLTGAVKDLILHQTLETNAPVDLDSLPTTDSEDAAAYDSLF